MKRILLIFMILCLFAALPAKAETTRPTGQELIAQTPENPVLTAIKEKLSEWFDRSQLTNIDTPSNMEAMSTIPFEMWIFLSMAGVLAFVPLLLIKNKHGIQNTASDGETLWIDIKGKHPAVRLHYHSVPGNAHIYNVLCHGKAASHITICAGLTGPLALSQAQREELDKEYDVIFRHAERAASKGEYLCRAASDISGELYHRELCAEPISLLLVAFHQMSLSWASAGDHGLFLERDGETIQLNLPQNRAVRQAKKYVREQIDFKEWQEESHPEELTSCIGGNGLSEFDSNCLNFPLRIGDRVLLCTRTSNPLEEADLVFELLKKEKSL